MYTGMILDNAINNGRRLKKANQLENTIIIDARSKKDYDNGHIDGAVNISLEALRSKANDFDSNATIVTYCNKGVTGNAAQNVMLNMGFKETYNLSGGYKQYSINTKEKK